MDRNTQTPPTIVRYLPIKHYSPSSARLADITASTQDYDTLCIELPVEAQPLLATLLAIELSPPISLLFQNNGGDTVVLPIAEYSPELSAIRAAGKRGKNIVFIDSISFYLNYAQKPQDNLGDAVTAFNQQTAEDTTINISNSMQLITALDSALEPLYENIVKVEDMLCRLGDTIKTNITEREQAMAARIATACGQKKLVVCGAAHMQNLKQLSNDNCTILQPASDFMPYIISYIPDDSAIFNYGYYALLHQLMSEQGDAFFLAMMHILITVNEKVREKSPGCAAPLPDLTQTCIHATALAAIRNKAKPMATEILESAFSIMCKGDEYSALYKELNNFICAIPPGSVPNGCNTALTTNFISKVNEYKLNFTTTTKVIINPSSNPQEFAKSCFLNQMKMLNVDFAYKQRGADFANKKDKNLVRETWLVGSTVEAEKKLIALSHMGNTVYNVCRKIISDKENELLLSDVFSFIELSLNAFFCGIDIGEKHEQLIFEAIRHTAAFVNCVDACMLSSYLCAVCTMFKGSKSFNAVTKALFIKATQLIDTIGVDEYAEDKQAMSLAKLYNLFGNKGKARVLEGCVRLCNKPYISSVVFGAALALLTRADGQLERQINYINSQPESADVGRFIYGTAILNRQLLCDKCLIDALAQFVENLSTEQFFNALPGLRYGFSFLKNSELTSVKNSIGAIYGVNEQADFISADEIFAAVAQDEYMLRQKTIYGLINAKEET